MEHKEYMKLIKQRHEPEMLEWIVSDDTGLSSISMWKVIMNVETNNDMQIPYDSWDFGKCYRLMQKFNLAEQDAILNGLLEYEIWKPIATNWIKLSNLYASDLRKEKEFSDELYDELAKLRLRFGGKGDNAEK